LHRRIEGVARALVGVVAAPAGSQGASEFAFDSALESLDGQAVPCAMGLDESGRIVLWSLPLTGVGARLKLVAIDLD
jgi:hypothetical protein